MKKVLIIDDDAWFAQAVGDLLGKMSFRVDYARHGIEAIGKIDSSKPAYDLLILDLFLPGPNGLVLLHEIRSYADLANLPIIMWSNLADKLDDNLLKPYGVRALIDKTTTGPKEIRQLVAHIAGEKNGS